MTQKHVHPDEIRDRFSRAMSEMYRLEVPQYGTLVTLVSGINEATLAADPVLHAALVRNNELDRLSVERHGAIRLGTARELFTIRRIFAVMGLFPVGYYDLSVAAFPCIPQPSARLMTRPCDATPSGSSPRSCVWN